LVTTRRLSESLLLKMAGDPGVTRAVRSCIKKAGVTGGAGIVLSTL
jgi:hypothetical protein